MNHFEPSNHQTIKPSNHFVRLAKRIGTVILLLLAILLLLWVWYIRERIADLHLEDTVKEEVSRVESKLDERGDAIETKLDRIEGKLDRLLYLLEPRLPDGMMQLN